MIMILLWRLISTYGWLMMANRYLSCMLTVHHGMVWQRACLPGLPSTSKPGKAEIVQNWDFFRQQNRADTQIHAVTILQDSTSCPICITYKVGIQLLANQSRRNPEYFVLIVGDLYAFFYSQLLSVPIHQRCFLRSHGFESQRHHGYQAVHFR